MLRKLTLLTALFLFGYFRSFAQAPAEGINYQAVARDANGNVLTSPITVRTGILSNSPNGTLIYQETHSVTPNSFGLFNLVIGQGTQTGGTASGFAAIDWSTGPYFAKTEINTGGSFINMGTSQLWSVPYALYARSAGNSQTITAGTGIGVVQNGQVVTISSNLSLDGLTDVNTAGAGNGQVLQFNGTDWVPGTVTGGGTFNAGAGININGTTISALDTDPANEFQNLSLSGQVLSISNGNSVTLPSSPVYVAGAGIGITGTTISALDISPTNEIQNLSITGNTLSISGGNSVTIPTGTTYTAGSGINITGSTISAVDISATNEIQTLTLSGNTLSISGGNSVTLSSGGGGTLNDAYNFGGAGAGRTITAGSGSVTINGPAGNTGTTGIALLVNQAGSSTAAIGAQVTGTGNAINAANTNAGNAFSTIQATTNSSTVTNSALFGQSSGAARGVTGEVTATATAGAAVYGNNLRTSGGSGVEGNGFNGVVGITNYSLGYGVYGANNATGVSGTGSDLGIGTYGIGFNGVYGQTTNTTTGWAGYFTADLGVDGTGYSAGGWVNASDKRLKSNITPIGGALQKISLLDGYRYTITTPVRVKDGSIQRVSREQFGVMAQELEKIFPEMVKEKALFSNTGDQTLYKTVDYIQLVPVLLEAVKELKAEVQTLKMELERK